MSAAAYLSRFTAWKEDRSDLPDVVVVYLPGWSCLANENATDQECEGAIQKGLTSRFHCAAAELAFGPSVRGEEKGLAANA